MKYRKLDQNDDYTFGKRDGFYFDTDAVAQAVKTRLLLLRGEWWENPDDGTPLFENILGQRFRTDETPAEADLILSERITGTIGVAEIIDFSSRINVDTREYSANITIRTIYDTDFQISLLGGSLLNIIFL
ncbi:MAG: hypothetical protein ACK5H4_15230 [Lacrimispora sphenoides]